MTFLPKYNFIIVGSGLFGSTFAERAYRKGYSVLIVEKRNHIGGNVYSENIDGINVHKYGPHIFHTNSKEVWEYVNRFCEWKQYQFSPIANYYGELYSLPFNMNTFYQIHGISKPKDLLKHIEEITKPYRKRSYDNLEDYAISQLGIEVYQKLIYGYTKKQWNIEPKDLPKSIIKRLPIRYTFDNNYFNDTYQAIPVGGYSNFIEKLTDRIEIIKEVDFLQQRKEFTKMADKVIYTGSIDEYYNYEYGELGYRSLKFETEKLEVENYQGCAVMNFTDASTPYTRIIEHKHFENLKSGSTIITKEFPTEYKSGMERYYPINNNANNILYKQYKMIKNTKTIFAGRLGSYQYYNMDQVIASAISLLNHL